MKTRLLTRQQLAAELERAARGDQDFPSTSRIRTARELMGDGMWAKGHYYLPEIDPQRIADAWAAEENRRPCRALVVGPYRLRLPRRAPIRIQITD